MTGEYKKKSRYTELQLWSEDYIVSRLILRLNVIDRNSAELEVDVLSMGFIVVTLPGGVGLWDNDARSSCVDFSRSIRCLLNRPIPGRYISIAGRSFTSKYIFN